LCAHSLRPLRFPAYCDQVSQLIDADEVAFAELNPPLLIIEKGRAEEGAATGCQDADGAVNSAPNDDRSVNIQQNGGSIRKATDMAASSL